MKKLQEINKYIESKLKEIESVYRTNRDSINKQIDSLSIEDLISNLDQKKFIENSNAKEFKRCQDVYSYEDDTLPKIITEITLYGPSSYYCQKLNSDGSQRNQTPVNEGYKIKHKPITIKIFYKIQNLITINKQKTLSGSEVRELYFKVRDVSDEQIQAYSKVAKKEGH